MNLCLDTNKASLIISSLQHRDPLGRQQSLLSCLLSWTLWPVHTACPAAVHCPALRKRMLQVSARRSRSLRNGCVPPRRVFLLLALHLFESAKTWRAVSGCMWTVTWIRSRDPALTGHSNQIFYILFKKELKNDSCTLWWVVASSSFTYSGLPTGYFVMSLSVHTVCEQTKTHFPTWLSCWLESVDFDRLKRRRMLQNKQSVGHLD